MTEEMADCIVQPHCFTGCDANSGIYGKGKSSVYDKVAKSPVARRQLSHCGDTLDLGEEELLKFTRHVMYGDKNSRTMAETRAAKWKEDDEEGGDHDVERRGDSSESDDSEAEFCDDMF